MQEYVQDLHRSLEESFKLARENLTLSHSKAKSRYDQKQRGRMFQVGVQVWLYNLQCSEAGSEQKVELFVVRTIHCNRPRGRCQLQDSANWVNTDPHCLSKSAEIMLWYT